MEISSFNDKVSRVSGLSRLFDSIALYGKRVGFGLTTLTPLTPSYSMDGQPGKGLHLYLTYLGNLPKPWIHNPGRSIDWRSI